MLMPDNFVHKSIGPQSLLEVNFTGLIFFISFVQDASRNSVCHTATVIANSYMHCGTTSDTFLRYAIN